MFVPEVSDSFQTEQLPYLITFRIQIVIRLISLSVLNDFTVIQSPVGIYIILDVFQLLVPSQTQFQSTSLILADITLGRIYSQHTRCTVIVHQNIGTAVIEYLCRCREVLPHAQVYTYIIFVGRFQFQLVYR